MYYIKGRDNLSATIHVTTPCRNNCPFCVNKDMYCKLKTNYVEFFNNVLAIAESDIEEIVISGGEPLANLEELELLIKVFKKADKKVFVNTSLPAEKFGRFVEIVREYDIDGINVSRHTGSEKEEEQFLRNVVRDNDIADLPNIRINTVITDEMNTQKIINRWSRLDIPVVFRADFRNVTENTLKTLSGVPVELLSLPMVKTGGCAVCQSFVFENDNITITYHKGLEYTSIYNDDEEIIVNDIVLFPDGTLCYDWDKEQVINTDDLIFHETSQEIAIYNHSACGGRPFTPGCGIANAGGACGMTAPCGSSSGSCGSGGGC